MNTLQQMAREAAAALLDAVRMSSAPPVDVAAIASTLGVDVQITKMLGDGRLEHHDDGDVIRLQPRTGDARRRFTIAHELGHYWLRSTYTELLERLDQRTEEQFCDAFASALLLPPSWLAAHGRERTQSIEELRSIASSAEVSLASCLLGLRREAGWTHSLLRWRLQEGDWMMVAATGVSRSLREELGTTPNTRRALTLLSDLREERRVWLVLSVGEGEVSVAADVAVNDRTAIALADLRPAVALHARAGGPQPPSAPTRRCDAGPGQRPLPWLEAAFSR